MLFPLLNAIYIRKTSKLGLLLDYKTEIGIGLDFPHNFPLIINPGAVIGKFCSIHPNVLIGGDRNKGGAPRIGDYVYIGNGAKIIGPVNVGSWCFIAPGAIVTKDVPEGCTVGGVNKVLNNVGKTHVMYYLSDEIKKTIK